MSTHPDFGPATSRAAGLLAGIADTQLSDPTPCAEYTLGDLIDHLNGLSLAFTLAARKQAPPGGSRNPSGDASRLDPDWRERIPAQLRTLAEAWRDPQAWDGMTEAGGVQLPGNVAGLVGLDEVVVHGWDIARASGQPYDVDEASLAACASFLGMSADQRGEGGPFGPVVEVADTAPALDRVIGLAGRAPSWTP